MAALSLCLAVGAGAEEFLIQSFDRSGRLTFNEVPSATVYRVEWSSSPDGPWTDSWNSLNAIVGTGNGSVTCSVPTWYRVVATVPPATPPVPPGMVLVPGGSFSMGASLSDGNPDELPVHTVSVSAFYMDLCEVTNDEMAEVLNWAYGQGKLTVSASTVHNAEGASQELVDLDDAECSIRWNGEQFVIVGGRGAGYPCVEVTWYGAAAYCNYRSLKAGGGHSPCYDLSDWSCDWSATGYRLPTEAEWEKAARGGVSGRRFPWGDSDTIQHARANYYSSASYSYDTSSTRGYHPDYSVDDRPYTSPVGSFEANGHGLYDMAGNVLEWCWDWYGGSYYGSSPGSDPQGPASGSRRVVRGGAWPQDAPSSRVAFRNCYYQAYSSYAVGFRAVLPLDQE